MNVKSAARVALTLALLACALWWAPSASAFGTTEPQGAGHYQVTTAALACPSNPAPSDNSCFRPRSLRELAGDGKAKLLGGYLPIVTSGYLGAVGKPDIRQWDNEQQHCDDIDYLPPDIAPSYPQSLTLARLRLGSCLYYLADQFSRGVVAAGTMADGKPLLDLGQASIPTEGCDFNSAQSSTVAKCAAIEHLGAALHGTEDFYSHTNWVDQATGPYTLINPPGLGENGTSALTSLDGTPNLIALDDMSDRFTGGCFSVEEKADAFDYLDPLNQCFQRVTHYYLTKDDLNTVRSQSNGGVNYYRAFQSAVEDTKNQWADFEGALDSRYGTQLGGFLACLITHDTPLQCYALKYSAAITVHNDVNGASSAGAWTLAMTGSAEPGTSSQQALFSGPVTENGSWSSSYTTYLNAYCTSYGPGPYWPAYTRSHQIGTDFNAPLQLEADLPQGATQLQQLTASTPNLPNQLEMSERVNTRSTVTGCGLPDGINDKGLVAGALGTAHGAQGLDDGATEGLELWRMGDWQPDGLGFTRVVQYSGPASLRPSSGSETLTEHFQLVPAAYDDGSSGSEQSARTSDSATKAPLATARATALDTAPTSDAAAAPPSKAPATSRLQTPGGAISRRQAPDTTTSPTPSITGTVSDATTGNPVSGVVVEVYDANDDFVTSTTTDSSGDYSVSRLADGSYEIEFDGSAVANYQSQFYDDESDLGSSDPVTVTTGATTSDIDAWLYPGGGLSGRVTDVSTGAGLGGVQVTLYDAEGGGSVASTTTGSDGTYAFYGLDADTYDIGFDASSVGNYLPLYYNGETSLSSGDQVAVAVGQTVIGVDAAMRAGGMLSGVVTDAGTHAPVVGATVTVYDSDGNSVGSATTDDSGAYTVEQLPTGTYDVGFAGPSGAGYEAQYYDNERSAAFEDPVPVTAGYTTNRIDAALQSSGQISGSVIDSSSDAPIDGVRVTLTSEDSQILQSTTTDAQGDYIFSALPPGSYTVEFAAPYGSPYLSPQYYNAQSTAQTADVIALAAGQTITGVDASFTQGASVSGTVTDATTHAPLEGVDVEIYDAAGDDVNDTETDANGSYSLTGLTAGTYKLSFDGSSIGNYPMQYYNGKTAVDTADSITVGAGATVTGIDQALTPGAEITGTVTAGPGGAGVADVTVTAYDNTGQPAATATTDPSGDYELTGLQTGTYTVGFDPASSGNYAAQFYPDSSTLSGAQDIQVTSGQTITAIGATLQQGGQITGTVTETGSDTPVPDASVMVYDSSDAEVANSTTDANGNYTVSGLTTGTYEVCSDDFGSTTLVGATVCFNGESDPGSADPVNVTAGQTTSGIDASFAPGAGISGTVTDAVTGQPVSDATVEVYDASGQFVSEAYTDDNGDYSVTQNLSAGTYTVEFTAAPWQNYLEQYDGDQATLASAAPIQLTASQVASGVDAALQPGGQISGTVTDASTNAPLPSIDVSVSDQAGNFITSTQTDGAGQYTVSGLPTGSYEVSFSSSTGGAGGNYVFQAYDGEPSLAQDDPVAVTAGQTTGDIDAALTPGGQIAGMVTDLSTGAGVSGVHVTVYDSSGTPVSWGTTDGAGRYSVLGLPAGIYRVGFAPSSAGNYLPQYSDGETSLDAADSVTVAAGQMVGGIDAALQHGGQISGTVTDASTRAPLQGITVTLYDSGGSSEGSVQTDANGSYTFNGLSAGTYQVGFESDDQAYLPQFANGEASLDQADPITVGSGQSVPGINAAMQAAGQISGTVTDASSDAALSGVQVTVYDANGAAAGTAQTAADGSYAVPGLPAGSYTVDFDGSTIGNYQGQYANNESSSATADPVNVAAGQSATNVNAALQTGGLISGTVTDAATQQPLQGVTVTLYDSSGDSQMSVTTNGNGHYELSGIPPGSYTVGFDFASHGYLPQFANRETSMAQADTITVGAGKSITGVDAAMQAGAQISGTITDATTGAALSDARATVYDSSGAAVGTAETDATGAYTVLGLRAGSYRVGFDGGGAGNYQPQYATRESSLASANITTLAAGQSVTGVDAALQPGGEISGTVTDASTGTPLQGITVTVSDGRSLPVATVSTDAAGTYTATGLPTASYTVGFDSDLAGDYLAQSYPAQLPPATGSPVSVKAGEVTAGINAALTPGGDISGTVTDATTGAPLAGAAISVYDVGGALVASTGTDASGDYTLSQLPAGAYKVGFDGSVDGNFAPQFANGKQSLTGADPVIVQAGSTASGVNAALVEGGQITGTVTDGSSGAPLQGITVSAYDATGAPIAAVDTDASGNYTIDGLDTATYRLGFQSDTGGSYGVQFYDKKPSLATADGVAVTAGTITSGIDAGLTPAGTGVPTNTALPTISGTAEEGETLTEVNGSWTNNPSAQGYSYQWLRCDSSGSNCAVIQGATGQTYVMTSADVGDTIEVQETARNAVGTSDPATSLPTSAVLPAPVVISAIRLEGPGGTSDRYVDLANTTASSVSVAGWTLELDDSSTPTPTAIPLQGTIAPYGHMLVADSGYATDAFAADVGADISSSFGPIATDGGVKLLDADSGEMDAVGFGGAPSGFFSGTPLTLPNTLPSGQYGWVRDYADGAFVNTQDNASDFSFVAESNAGDSSYGSPILGDPAPLDASSPTTHNDVLQSNLLDPNAGLPNSPNRVYTPGSDGSPGTLLINRTLTNCTGQPTTGSCVNAASGTPPANVTRLQFRVAQLTTQGSPGPNSQAVLVPISSSGADYSADNNNYSVEGMNLADGETIGGLNSVWLTGVSSQSPLSPGSSINVQFAFEVLQPGHFSFGYNAEDDLVPVKRGGSSSAGAPKAGPSTSAGAPPPTETIISGTVTSSGKVTITSIRKGRAGQVCVEARPSARKHGKHKRRRCDSPTKTKHHGRRAIDGKGTPVASRQWPARGRQG